MSTRNLFMVYLFFSRLVINLCFLSCPYENYRNFDRQNILSIENYSYGVLKKETVEGIESALPDMKTLIIRNDSIHFIEPKTFEKLINLICLDLSGNELSTLEASTFFGLTKLLTLILSHNQLKSINADPPPFLYLENLEKLDLSDNYIGVLHSSSLRGLTNLKFLNLENNLLTNVARTFYFVTNLSGLDISHNPLELLDVSEIESLSSLSAFSTKLERLPVIPSNLKVLDLQQCNISEIYSEELKTLSNLEKVYLNGNPWKCTCNLLDFVRWLNSTKSVVDKSLLVCKDFMKIFVTKFRDYCFLNDTNKKLISERFISLINVTSENSLGFGNSQFSSTVKKFHNTTKSSSTSTSVHFISEPDRTNLKYLLFSIPIGFVIGFCLSVALKLTRRLCKKNSSIEQNANSSSPSMDGNNQENNLD